MKTRIHIIILLAVLLISSCSRHEESSEWHPTLSESLSNQHVTAIAEDEQGFIWVGTERGLNRYDSRKYRQYFTESGLPSNRISTLFQDSHRRLWVGTDKGLCLYDSQEDRFIEFPSDAPMGIYHQIWETPDGRILVNMIERLCEVDTLSRKVSILIPDFDPDDAFINECYPDSEGNFWSVCQEHLTLYGSRSFSPLYEMGIGATCFFSQLTSDGTLWLDTTSGVQCFDTRSRIFISVPGALGKDPVFSKARINQIEELWEGVLFIFTDKGAFLYTKEVDNFYYSQDLTFPQGIGIDDITCLFRDSRGDLWIGSRFEGLANTHFWNNTPFNTDQQLKSLTEGIPVSSLALDVQGNLWISGINDLLVRIGPDYVSERISLSDKLGKSGQWDSPPLLFADSAGRIWLIHKARLYQIRGGQFVLCPELDRDVSCLAEDEKGTVWAGSGNSNRLWRLEAGWRHFRATELPIPKLSRANAILPLKDGRLLLGMTLANPILYSPEDASLERVPIWKKAADMSMVEDMSQAADETVWIGTRSDGVWTYEAKTGVLSHLEGLSCEEIASIQCSTDGDAWLATLSGLNYIHDGQISVYHADDGTGGDQYSPQASLSLPDGRMLFGGNHGITLFNPSVEFTFYKAPLYFEDLNINGSYARPLNHSASVRLGYRDRQFSISYAHLEFSGYHAPHFFYRLKGFQDDWMDNGSRTEVFYSNLPAGKYTLQVRTVPTDERQEAVFAEMPIRIIPAPWNSWWAWTLYILVALAVLVNLYLLRIANLKEKEAAKRAALEKEQEQRINQMNMSFFANISHEFRTPLTLISGPVTQMEKGETSPAMLSTVKWNVARMLRLVNQLMDFSKLEGDTLRLKVYAQDVVALLRSITGSFSYSMEQKGISFQPSGMEESYFCPIDEDKLDKIVSNLLSNATKYTPTGGNIGCAFDIVPYGEGKCMQIKVWNTGPTIPEASLERIFERYYQVENHHNYGTGIGLYFARRLAELHHGSLHCENLEGIGPAFTLLLPASDVYSAKEHLEEAPLGRPALFAPDEVALHAQERHQAQEQTLLVVDDDPGIVRFLESLFSEKYNVHCAYNGTAALESARTEAPDLIVSDVAMPEMDGYELCRLIKEDRELCHIPVILVTAKTTVQNQIEGLQQGADAYVTKPFDPEVLQAMVDSQLANRARIRALFGEKTQVEEVQQEVVLAPQDSKLMKDFYALMEEELSNDMLNIDHFADKLHVSRSKFYYKIKALTGDSPSAFFKTYKLNRAKEMLQSGAYRVSEVADITGFSTPSVFGRNFKAQFGMTPTEFLESRRTGRNEGN